MKIYYTEDGLKEVIEEMYPELTGAEQNLLRLDLLLRAQGSSLEEVLDRMTVKGSPFLKLSSRI